MASKADVNYKNLLKYCTIEKNKVICNCDMKITLSRETYKDPEEESINISENDDEDFVGTVSIPGAFEIEIPEDNMLIDIYLPFDINLVVNESEIDKENITYYFQKNDILMFVFTKSNATNIKIVDKLFENGIKHLTNKIDRRILAIYDQLSSTGINMLHHIELLVSASYIANTNEGYQYTRLTPSQKYDETTAMNIKSAVHAMGTSSNAFAFGYTKDAINTKIAAINDPKRSDLANIISGDFEQLEKER